MDKVGDIYGASTKAEMEAANVSIVEIYQPARAGGVHENSPTEGPTIGVQSKYLRGQDKMGLTGCAIVAYHEFRHLKNAIAAGSTVDPTTQGQSGNCVHAGQQAEDILDALADGCPSSVLDPVEYVNMAAALGMTAHNMDIWTAICLGTGGSGTPPQTVADARTALEECFGE